MRLTINRLYHLGGEAAETPAALTTLATDEFRQVVALAITGSVLIDSIPASPAAASEFDVGDKVKKKDSDYRFDGVIVAVFAKLSGVVRYVVEDDRGVLFIHSDKSLEPRP